VTGSALLIFLDRDGVLVDPVPREGMDPEAPLRSEDVRLSVGALEGLDILRELRATVVLVSNQPAAAKSEASLASLLEVHERFIAVLADEGHTLSGTYYCWHHPDAVESSFRGPCNCRKPQPGLLLAAAAELGVGGDLTAAWMVGDTDADVGAGNAVGATTILIEHPLSAHRRTPNIQPDFRAADLADAARIIRTACLTSSRPGTP